MNFLCGVKVIAHPSITIQMSRVTNTFYLLTDNVGQCRWHFVYFTGVMEVNMQLY